MFVGTDFFEAGIAFFTVSPSFSAIVLVGLLTTADQALVPLAEPLSPLLYSVLSILPSRESLPRANTSSASSFRFRRSLTSPSAFSPYITTAGSLRGERLAASCKPLIMFSLGYRASQSPAKSDS